MKLFPIIVLAFAYANANSIGRYGWTPGQEYLYRFESQVLTGIPDINKSQYSGVKLTAQARVQAQNDYTLRIKLDQVKFMTLNGEIDLTEANRIIQNGGPRSGAKEQLPSEFKQLLETPMEVHLKKGLVEKFTMVANEPVAVTNIKRSFLAQLQLDVSRSQLGETESNLIAVGSPVDVKMPFYSVVEQSLHGRCRTNYNVNPLTTARAMELEQEWAKEEIMARLVPSNGTQVGCAGKRYYEVIRTRDLNSCDSRPVFQKVSGADVNIDVTKTNAGNLMSHVDSTTTTICGDLSSFIVRKVVVDDTFVSNPVGYNTEQTLKSSARIMIELMNKRPIQSPVPLPSQHFFSQSLEYAYPNQGHISQEVVRQTMEVLGTYPILPQPGLSTAPTLMLPVKIDKQVLIPQMVQEVKRIAQQLHSNPETMKAEEDISGKIMTIANYMEIMSINDLEKIWTQCVSGSSNADAQKIVKELLLDTIAMVGTNPATMFVLKQIEAFQPNEIPIMNAVFTLQSAIKNIKTPTNELLRQLISKIQEWKRVNTAEKQSLLTSALLQVSNLFYHAYVNPETMASNYPVRIYGIFGTKNSPILKNEYIPALKQILDESRQQQNRQMEMVAITALGKLGHHDATKILVQVAEGAHQEQPMVRALAVHSMKRTAKRHPDMLINVLLAIINNPEEVADVRIAALSILPWAQPRYSELQQIAVRSWVEPSRQVASFARSMLMNLQYTEEPELKPLAKKVRNILHLLKPAQHGLQYSKHFDLSNFVEYLLASVSSRVSIANSKVEPAPSRIEMSTDMYLEALGEGLKLRTHSFKLYSQGFEQLIDDILKRYSDYQVASPEVTAELNKIAQMIKLRTRHQPSYPPMAFIQHNIIGYEYAAQVKYEEIIPTMQRIIEAYRNAQGVYKGSYVGVKNLVSLQMFGMNQAGFPVAGKIDNPSVFAVSATYEKEAGAQNSLLQGQASFRPVWNGKVQSDICVISPFTNEAVTTGVSMSAQVAIPFEVKFAVRQGELDINLKVSEATKQSGNNVEMIHLRVLPYTARKDVKTMKPICQSQDLKKIVSGQPLKTFQKQFDGILKGNIRTESDNDLVDFQSYWEKIRQHNVPSLLTLGPLMSSVRMSSLKLAIEPAMSEEIDVKLRLWARQTPFDQIAYPIGAQPIQDIKSKGMVAVEKTLELLNGAPATVIKVEAAVKRQSSVVDKYEAYTVFGAKMTNKWQIKPAFAAYAKLPQSPQPSGLDFTGNLYLTKFKARWNIDDLIQQAPELTLNAKAHYGTEGRQELITLHTKLARTEQLVQSLRASPEFKRCQELARQERLLAPICIKVRQQAGAYDQAEISLHVPQKLTQSHYLRMVERLFKVQFWAYLRPILPRPQVPSGKLDMVMNVDRAGKVAHVEVRHAKDAYKLKNVRIPYLIQGVFPVSGRVNLLEWLEQKATLNMAPASCRVEPRHITTFDNVTYSYKIPSCEHVLMTDGSRKYPVAVLAQNTPQQGMIVKILAGRDIIQIGSSSRATEVLINGQHKAIYPGQQVDHYVQDQRYPSSSGRLVATIRRYNNEDVYYVYVPQQSLKVVTDGKRVEVIAPQFLHRRTVGLCGNLDGERVACVQSPGQCAMRPNLAAMSYMLNENARCSVQTVFPGEFAEYKKELDACRKEHDVPTQITPIFEKSLSGNGVWGFESAHGHKFGGENGNMAKFGGAGVGIAPSSPLEGNSCRTSGYGCSYNGECCSKTCSNGRCLGGCKKWGDCSSHSQCCTNICRMGRCIPTDHPYGTGRMEDFGGEKLGMGTSGEAPLGGEKWGMGTSGGAPVGGEKWGMGTSGGAPVGGEKWGMGTFGGAPVGRAKNCSPIGWACSSTWECCSGTCVKHGRYSGSCTNQVRGAGRGY